MGGAGLNPEVLRQVQQVTANWDVSVHESSLRALSVMNRRLSITPSDFLFPPTFMLCYWRQSLQIGLGGDDARAHSNFLDMSDNEEGR